MPRVTEEHRERRRQQILDAARRCFIRQGFHQTSMTDIFAESGLSAGAVYGYFRGKDEIIRAIAAYVLSQISGLLEPIVGQDPPPPLDEAIHQGLTASYELTFGENGFAKLAPQVWAEALRNPELAEVIRTQYTSIHDLITHLVAAEQQAGRISPDGDPAETAKVLIGAIMGYLLQGVLIANVDADSYASGLATLVSSHYQR